VKLSQPSRIQLLRLGLYVSMAGFPFEFPWPVQGLECQLWAARQGKAALHGAAALDPRHAGDV
jgi:hypothetical protein